MNQDNIPYEKQIFVCTNDNANKNGGCAARDGLAIFKELRQIAKDKGLHPTVRVAQAKCLGQCARGANVMVYPDNLWYSAVSMEDIQAIADKHITSDQ